MTNPGDTSESLTTTQQIIIQQTTMDVTSNTQTTTSQSTWLPQKSLLTTSKSSITTVDSPETAKPNSTVTAQGEREGQDVAVNPGLIAVLCIFCIAVAVVVAVVIAKAVRSRRPQFERLDDVSMGKINENAPFAHYPPK
ncbi:protein CIST1-like [Pseudorasbora parva]|uniref:protein CIST1-like n=1 Tax=Pseudorasbora parva TaxID=51549 RepID=UPI00351E1BF2